MSTWTVVVAGDPHVFDDAVLSQDDSSETRQAVLAEMVRWGMIVATADRAFRAADSAYRNWKGNTYGHKGSSYGQFPAQQRNAAEWKFRANVEAQPEFPIMRERLANAEEAATKARAIYEALQRKADMLAVSIGLTPPAGSKEIDPEQCEPGEQYMVRGRLMTYLGESGAGARFRDDKGMVCLKPEETVVAYGIDGAEG